jgi:hypothetical protein
MSGFSPTMLRRAALALAAFSMLMVCGVASAAAYSLEIIAPRQGLTTENRYYKAYPGLLYEVDVAVIGGRYPYTFTLGAAPNGMSIDPNSGRITWTNPQERTDAYPVSVTVRDSDGATSSVAWTILVTTAGFRFIDAVNGRSAAQGGDGSRSNPWRSIADWYRTKYDSEFRGTFLYYRNGTYRTADAPIEDGTRLALTGHLKPLVWLAYPNEKPVIDTTGSHISIYGGSNNVYFDGLTIRNFTTRFGVNIESSGQNKVFRKNTFANLPSGSGGSGTNASAIMIARGSVGRYWALLNNEFSQINDVGYGILGYNTDRVLVQGNRFTNFTVSESKAIGPKMANSMWFIRDNRIDIAAGQGIWVDTYADSQNTRDIEISYNLVNVRQGYTLWVGQEPTAYGAITSFRNSYIGAQVRVGNLFTSSGPVAFDRDVIVNDTSTSNRIRLDSNGVASRLILTDLIVGSTSDNIVDAAGNLAGDYVRYVGTRGYQQRPERDAVSARPMAPSALSVE